MLLQEMFPKPLINFHEGLIYKLHTQSRLPVPTIKLHIKGQPELKQENTDDLHLISRVEYHRDHHLDLLSTPLTSFFPELMFANDAAQINRAEKARIRVFTRK